MRDGAYTAFSSHSSHSRSFQVRDKQAQLDHRTRLVKCLYGGKRPLFYQDNKLLLGDRLGFSYLAYTCGDNFYTNFSLFNGLLTCWSELHVLTRRLNLRQPRYFVHRPCDCEFYRLSSHSHCLDHLRNRKDRRSVRGYSLGH
jgi:hypothetical protein